MSVIVTDSGFGTDDWTNGFVAREDAPTTGDYCIDLPSDTAPETLAQLTNAPMIRIDFPSFADGRGFTLAAMLRRAGFKGRLRAKGHVIADQYAMARRSGFDEVEIDETLAARQPENQWLFRAKWQSHDYQARVRG
ncbi:DUF934 domain-containing protein [Loktanella sp. S4079]|uniref:DUF934 domain-containing protein n=1 Tax=Loktanella sp. S4079 TaxID=579483 RepID=UPI0005FA5D93|nr:DUF934 domain-containing protein [Loktanella sp. S4079]KJZ19910.1 oxidoreductase probably [Loktanella sp. S4079]